MATRPGHLRPRSLPDILDGAVRHYRARFLSFVLPFIPLGVVQVLGALMLVGFFGFLFAAGESGDIEDFDAQSFSQWMIFTLGFGIVASLVFLPGFGSVVLMAGTDLAGRKIEAGAAWRQASSRIGGLIGLSLLFTLFQMLAAVVFVLVLAVGSMGGPIVTLLLIPLSIIPNLYVWVVTSLCAHAFLLEGKDAFASMSRSQELMKGSFWWGVGILVFVGVVNMALGTLSSFPQYLAPMFADDEGNMMTMFYIVFGFSSIVSVVVNLFLMPLYTLLYTHFYWDIRVRKEGLDLDTKLRTLEAPAA